MRFTFPGVLVVWLALLGGVRPVPAQTRVLEGPSIDRFSRGSVRLTTVNFRKTEVTPGRSGLDVAIGFVPDYLGARTLLLHLDGGFAYAMPAGPATVLLKGGAAGFFGLGQVHDFYPGLHVGLALVMPLQARCNVRLELSRRYYYLTGEGALPVWSMGVGLAVGSPH